MPTDQANIDRILDTIFARKEKEKARETMPPSVPKAILRKYTGYLPKPPPPKLPQRRERHRAPKKEELESEGDDEMLDAQPSRDWFPNREYREDEEMGEWENMDEQYEQENQGEMEEGETEDLQEAGHDEPGQQEQQEWEGEEEWPGEYEEEEVNQDEIMETQEGQSPEELEGMELEMGQQEEGWYQNDAEQDEEAQYPNVNQDEPEDATAPIPAPMLEPAQKCNPSFVPLNMGAGGGKHMTAAKGTGKGYHTPLTRPVVMQNPLITGKGWVHPIQDPAHPVHTGKGWIDTSQYALRPPMQKGTWTPPCPPPYPNMHPLNHQTSPGFERFMRHATSAAAEMPPGWTFGMHSRPNNKANAQLREFALNAGYDASEESEAAPQYMAMPKGKGKGKGKAHKKTIWINIQGQIHPAYYWGEN